MNKASLRLEYARVGEQYDGSILKQVFPTRGLLLELDLKGATFPQLMSNLARVARKLDECTGVTLVRKEAPNPYVMSPSEVAQLIHDPAAAISSMSLEDRVVVVRDDAQPLYQALRTGHDTLADAFGDYVYCRRREFTVEDPLIGRWTGLHRPLKELVPDHKFSTIYDRDPSAGHGPRVELPWLEAGDRWLKTPTSCLIEIGPGSAKGFYLPRRWHGYGSWITRGQLMKKYETFCKERDDATNRATDGSDGP